MDILDQISREAQKAGEFIVEKATLAKDYTVATWNTNELRNEINKRYTAIGKAVYTAHTTEADTAEEINEQVEALQVLHQQLQEKEELRQAMRNRKICPACDKPIDKGNTYCPHCGTQVK